MDRKEVLRIFEATGAIQNGHFELTSGLHSPAYFQCALALQYPQYLQSFCHDIVEFYHEEEEVIDIVAAPAIGGIVVAQEVGRQLGVRSIFMEREDDRMTLRRGFAIEPRENVLVVEDVITTGGSVSEVIQLAEEAGGFVVGVGCIVDRSGGKLEFEVPITSAHKAKLVTYPPEKCPLCMQKKPLVKPGSRPIKI
jgi:orotate phosphoribosyltransferase